MPDGLRETLMTIERYCKITKQSDKNVLEQLQIAHDRADYLDRSEWQRWTPVLGTLRLTRSLFNGDRILLSQIRSPTNNLFNAIYNVTTTLGTGLGLFYLIK